MRRGIVWLLLVATLIQIALPAVATGGETEPVSSSFTDEVTEEDTEPVPEEAAAAEEAGEEEEASITSEPSGESGTETADESEEETPDPIDPVEEETSSALEEQETAPAEEESAETPAEPDLEELPEEETERLYNGQEADFNDPEFVRLLENGYFDAADNTGIATFSARAAATYAWEILTAAASRDTT